MSDGAGPGLIWLDIGQVAGSYEHGHKMRGIS